MRVVFINRIVPPDYNGAGRGALYQAQALQKIGVEACLVASRVTPETAAHDIHEGIPVYRLPDWKVKSQFLRNQFFYLHCGLWLLKNRNKYDVVQCAGNPRHWYLPFLVTRLLHKPTYVTMSLLGSDDLQTVSKRRSGGVELAMLRQIQGIMSVGDKMIEVSRPYIPDDRLLLVRRPIDMDVFRPVESADEKAALRHKHNVPQDAFVIIFSGSVIKRKGVDLLIDAMPKIREQVPRAMLYLAGPREDYANFINGGNSFLEALDKRIAALHLQKSVVFLGDVGAQVPEWLRLADVFTLPSRSEGLGKAIVEAMATGLPTVIAKADWVTDDHVQHGESGIIADLDAESLADAIIRFAQDPAYGAQLGEQAMGRVHERFSADRIAHQMRDIYARGMAALGR